MPIGKDSEPIYITRDDLDAAFAAEWDKLGRRLEEIIADAMTACAKAWMPQNPAHIGEAAVMLGCLLQSRCDDFVADLEKGVVVRLMQSARPH